MPVVDDSAGYSVQRALLDPAQAPAPGRRPPALAALRAAAALPPALGGHHPRLHPPALPRVPAQPHGLALRALHDGQRDPAQRPRASPSPRPRAATSCASIPTPTPTASRWCPTPSTRPSSRIPGEEEMERVRERYQIRGRFVLYAGNIKPHKNLERLIAAFGLLKQRPGHEDVKLLIIGDEIEQVRLAAPQRRGGGRAPGRALLRLRARPDAGRALPAGRRCSRSRRSTRASACRRSRPWPAARRW